MTCDSVRDGEVVLNLACSFAVPEEGIDNQLAASPLVSGSPGRAQAHPMALPSIETRAPEQPSDDLPGTTWIRCELPLPPDPLLNACVLTYVSDLGTGLASLASTVPINSTTTLDHSRWFHRPVSLSSWVLLDLQPGSTAGRGWYTGPVHDEQGVHVASLVQEKLFRRPRA